MSKIRILALPVDREPHITNIENKGGTEMRDFKDFDTMEKELGEKRAVISALDFANEAVAITTAAIDVMSLTQSKELATAVAAMKTSEALSKLFPEEPQEEKSAEKDAKFDDLKNRIFNHAASYKYPIAATVESLNTTEIRRDAKHAALISLILNAGLAEEYHDWLRKNGYE